ncbi:MAG: 5-(carboxyamino)imidazole ribonucleotide mutase, partial [Proteobacteria bacterium]|nr:5-(carboxyamino)imidazole ribonucleotide mutase [Pseudomonadota bacterium]
MSEPVVGIVMGSRSDLPTMQGAVDIFTEFGVEFEAMVLSAHRAPDRMLEYAAKAEERGIQVLIAGAGMAAALPGMLAATTVLPVLGVPIVTKTMGGLDSLLSIVQMPRGVPVGTLAIGGSGATNAALLSIQILALHNDELKEKLRAFRARRAQETAEVLSFGND